MTAMRRVPAWISVVVILILVLGATVAGVLIGRLMGATEERSTQVVRSVKLEEEVILLSAGIADVKERREDQKFFGLFDIPGTEREMFVKYEFDAKFGIDGARVEIEQTGDKKYRITIPEFEYLGSDDPDFESATETNGILSWSTPQIDKFEFVENVLTPEAVAEHLEGFRPMLELQAEAFYSRIVTSIEPDAELVFVFAGDGVDVE